MLNFIEILDNLNIASSSEAEFVNVVNAELKGKSFKYISNAEFEMIIEFDHISIDTFQVNSMYNPNNLFEV